MSSEERAKAFARDDISRSEALGPRGYVIGFDLDPGFPLSGPYKDTGEYAIPAEQMADFNDHLRGPLYVAHVFENGHAIPTPNHLPSRGS